MVQIKCKGLSAGYDGKIVFKCPDIEIEEGDYICIVGENGSGKSTFMKILLGLLQPVEGSVDFENGLKKEEIGYLPQQDNISREFPASVMEVVLSGCVPMLGRKPFFGKKEKNHAIEQMRRVNIEDLSGKRFGKLSGGQQRRVLLARALCSARKMLLLDEPAAGLDARASALMYEQISSLNKEGMTIIMITHDAPAADEYADKILHPGKEVFWGSLESYRESRPGKRFFEEGK